MKKNLLLLLTVMLSMPLVMNAQLTATFGTATTSSQTGGSAGSPMSGGTVFSYTQNIYTAAELTAAGVPAGAVITAIEFSNGTGGSLVLQNCRTYMAHRATTSFSSATDYTPYSELTLVDSSDWVTTGSGWFMVNLTNPYVWNGTGNLLVAVSYGGASLTGTNIGYNYTTQTESRHWRRGCRLNNGPVDAVYASYPEYTATSTPSGTAFTTLPTTSTYRPNLRITYILSGCPSLTPNVANIGPYTADLNWINFQQSVSSWDIMYGEQGTFDTLSGGATITGVTDTFYTLAGLTSATTYAVYMKPYCTSDIGTWSAPRVFTTTAACPTPTNLTVMSHTAEEAIISWMPGSTETGWEVACVPHGTLPSTVTPDYATSSPYTITNLIDNTQYDVYVRADCGNGENSYWTSAVTFTTDPYCTPPTNVMISQVHGTSALISWSSALVGADDYTVAYSESGMNNWTSYVTTATSYMLSGLTPHTNYDVMVWSNCMLGSADTVQESFITSCLSGGEFAVGTGTATSTYFPSYSFYKNAYSQQIFLASELNGSQEITSVAFEMTAVAQQRNFKIYLMHTNQSASSAWIPADSAQLCFQGSHTFVVGWNTFNFTTPFQYNGTDNLVLIVVDENSSYSSGNTFKVHTVPSNTSHLWYSDSYIYDISTTPGGTSYSTTTYRNNVKFGGDCDSVAVCVSPNMYISNVTDNSITVDWAPGYTESSWELEYSTDNTSWTPEGVVGTTPYTISNLTANTLYYIRLRSVCGGGEYSNWVQVSRRTECTAVETLPIMENFDSYPGTTSTSEATNNLPDCWTNLNEGTSTSYSGYPIIYNSSSTAASGTNSIRFYTYITAGTYDDQVAILPPIDVNTFPMNTLQVAFDARALSTSYTFKLDVGIMTDPTDRNSFVTMQTLNLTSTTYENFEVPFSQYLGTGQYIALRAPQPTSGYNYGYVDNVRVELIPACPKPTNVVSSAVTTNSITLGWTEVGTATSWEIEYGPAGFTPGTAAGTVETVYTNPYTVMGLNSSTNYDFYVRSDCGGDYSNYSNVHTEATACDLISTLPLMENFDSYAGATTTSVSVNNLPVCWSNLNTGTSTSYSGYPIIYNSSTTAASGTNAMRFYMYTTSGTYSDQIAILPPIDVNTFPMNTLQLSFDARRMSSSYTFNVVVGVMTDPTVASTFTPVQTISVPSITYENFEVPLTSYTGTGAYIAIKAPLPTSNYNEGYIDNVVVEIAPLCDKPTNVTVSNITATTADVNWMPGGSETDWELVVVPHGASVATGTAESVSTHPYTVYNLDYSTSYDVYVRADCGTGVDFSSWSQVHTFTTTALCSPPTNVEISLLAGASALVTWTEAAFGANAYTLSYTETGMNNWVSMSVSGDNYMLTGLTPETPYTLTITSECTEGVAPTITKNFTTPCLYGGTSQIGNGTTTTYTLPLNNFYNYSYTQQIFLASEMSGAATISNIAFEYAYSSPSTDKNNVSIYLGHTSKTSFSSATDYESPDSLQLVYTGPLNCQQGWNTFNFTNAFQYNGIDNLVIAIDDNSGDYNGSSYTFYAHDAGAVRSLYFYSDTYNMDPNNPGGTSASSSTTTSRTNIKISQPCDYTVTCIAPNIYIAAVTENSMTLNWAPGNTESSWELETSTDGTTWTSEGTVTTAPYTLSNLTPNTLYYVRMRGDCGGGEYSSWSIVSERTECAAISSVPYMENFDSYAGTTATSMATNNLPNCWTFHNEGTSTSYSGYPIIYNSSSTAASGANSIRFYTYTTSGTYDDQTAILPEIDVNTLPMNTLQLSFDARALSTSYPFNLEVGVMTDPTDINTFMTVSTITTQVTTYANYEIPLSQYAGTGAYIALRAPQPTSNYNYGYVDNVKIELIPMCPKPTNVHAMNVSTNTVQLGWLENGTAASWEIEYGPAGFTLGTGTVESASSNPHTIANLNASTVYDFYVRSDCGGGEYSNYSTVATVATACDAIDQLPYTEGFDTYGTGEGHYPNCWSKINTYSSDRPYVNSTHYAGVGSLYFYAGTSGTYNMAITPPFDATIPVNTLQATFMYRSTYATDYLIVGVMTNPTDASTFVPVDTIYPSSTASTWVEREVIFSQYQGTGQYIAFKNAYTSTYCYGYVDNLVIDLIPACPKPNQVHVTSASTNTIELGWTENGSATSWVIEYGPAGFTLGNGTVESATTNPYTISGLTASTQYDFYIKSDCGSGEYSTYSSVFTASTECDAISQLPFTENFDTYGTGTTVYVPCWGKINTYSSDRPYVNSTNYAGVGSLYFYAGSATYNIAILPQFDASIPVNTLQASFMYRASSTTDYMIVGVMTNASDASTFVPVDTIYPSSTASTWVEKEVVFSGYTGNGHYIAFYNGKPTTTCYSYIDNLSINLIPSCPKPTHVTVTTVDQSSLSVSWQAGGSETNWNLEYGPAGFTPGTGTILNNVTSPTSITGLSASTSYDVYVQADCGGGEYSNWSAVGSGNTSCGAITSMPFSEGFDTYGTGTTVYPLCWSKINTYTSADRPYVNSTHYAGVGSLYFYAGTSGTYNIAITPEFDSSIPMNGLTASFMYRATYATDRLIVGVMSSTTDATTFVPVDTVYPGSTASTWVAKTVSFANYTGSGHYVAFKNEYTSTYCYAYIDNLLITLDSTVTPPVTCATPTGLAVNNITANTATASWTAGGTENSWNVQYKAASASSWQSATANATSYTMTGLTPNTAYQVRVQANCGAGNTSDWTTAVSFTTAQEQQTCPAPTNLNASLDPNNHTTVILTWQQEANTANEWQINYRISTESTWSTVTANATTYTLTDLTPNESYVAHVVAHCTNGLTSDESNTVTFDTDNIGIGDHLAKSVNLYPNPATEMIAVEVSDANIMITGVEVYNVYGQLINTIISTENPLRINVSGLADGMYYVRVTTDSGVVTKNFVKR